MQKYILIIFYLIVSVIYPQEQNYNFTFLSPGLHFMPLRANMQEARIGVLYFPDNANLKVDIGNNIDLLGFSWLKEKIDLTCGIEFMAYALSTNFAGRRLQIDALDGFFGGNVSFSKRFDDNVFQMRFRIIHNSAHFVDGHFDSQKNEWMDNSKPIPFTRDFGEVTFAHKYNEGNYLLRYYGSVAYSTLIRPDDQKKYSFALGCEINSNKIIGKIFSKDTNLFCAYHLNIRGIPLYTGDNHIMTGIKFGGWDDKGIVLYFSYFSGNNYFSEYYLKKINKIGLGFSIDFI
jgi:hypothetical protein